MVACNLHNPSSGAPSRDWQMLHFGSQRVKVRLDHLLKAAKKLKTFYVFSKTDISP